MIDILLNFKQWIKEQTTAAAPSTPVAAAPSANSSSTTNGVTLSSDIAKVPTRIGCGKDCGKDFFKNWHHKKKRKK
jgi:hypothetical protein